MIMILAWPGSVGAKSVTGGYAGKFITASKDKSVVWYVSVDGNKRYALSSSTPTLAAIRSLATNIPDLDFQKIAQSTMPVTGDKTTAKKYAGKIIRDRIGGAWYVSPKDLKKYSLNFSDDYLSIASSTDIVDGEKLAKIHKPGDIEAVDAYSKYEHKKIRVKNKAYAVDMVTIDLSDPDLKIMTDTTENENLAPRKAKGVKKFSVKPLGKFAAANKAFAAINGSYFCSNDGCKESGYYFYPVYNSNQGKMINDDQLKYWTTGPIMAFDTDNKFYFFKDSREFGSVADFEKKYGVKLQAAIGNKPRLIQDGLNYLIEWEMDKKQLKSKSTRNAIGYKDNKVYLVVAGNATVPELADIMQELGMQYALNLDGGYSSALYYNDEYMVGPGRDIPNAIVFGKK